jgi:hypothetical protein
MTNQKDYKNKILVLLLLIPFISVFAGLILVKQTQEVRREAAYGEINLQLLPDVQEVDLDQETANVQLQVLPEEYLVSGGHFSISYDPNILEFQSVELNENYNGVSQVVDEGVVETVSYLKSDGQIPAEPFNLAGFKFKLLNEGSSTLSKTAAVSFVGSKGVEGVDDRVLDIGSFSDAEIDVLGGEPTPIPTEPPAGWPELSFQITFGGTKYLVNNQEKIVEDIGTQPVDVIVKGNGISQRYKDVMVEFDNQAVGTGSLELVGVEPGDNYAVLIKGPVHLARRFCEDEQVEHCWLGEEGITLNAGENEFDWTALNLEPGDIDQNGVVNSADFTTLKQALMVEGEIEEDINFNGIVNSQDVVFFLETLSTKYEDEL